MGNANLGSSGTMGYCHLQLLWGRGTSSQALRLRPNIPMESEDETHRLKASLYFWPKEPLLCAPIQSPESPRIP